MATMDIKAIVTGEQDVKKLGDSIENMGTQAEATSVKTVALGNVGATAIEALGKALVVAVQAGAEFNSSIEEVNGTLTTTNELQERSTSAFGALSGAILEGTGAWDGYRNSLEVLTVVMETVTEAIGGMTAKELEHEQIMKRITKERIADKEKEVKEWAKHDAWVQKEKEKSHRADMKRKKEAYDADVAQQKNLSRIEAIVAKEMAEKEAKIKAEEKAYEDLLVANDAWVDSVNEAVDAQIELSQAMDGSSESIDKQTDSITSNTEAQKSGSAGTTFQSDGKKIDGATAYALHSGMISYGQATGDYGQAGKYDKYFEEIARNTRQTNQYLGGI